MSISDALKQRINDLYYQADDLMSSGKLFSLRDVQDVTWQHGFLFALMLAFDGEAEYDVSAALTVTEEALAKYVNPSGRPPDSRTDSPATNP